MACSLVHDPVFFYIQVGAGGLGFFGSLGIMLAYLRFPLLRTFSNKLILNLALAQFLCSFTFFFPVKEYQHVWLCVLIGVSFNSLQLCTIFWAFSIVFTLYVIIGRPFSSVYKYFKYWLVIGWFVIPAVSVLPLVTDSYSKPSAGNGYICTYKVGDAISDYWRIGLFYAPAWAFIVLSSVIYCKVFKKLEVLKLEGESKEFINRLFYYPVIVLCYLVPLSTIRVYQQFENTCASLFVIKLVSLLLGVQGLLYALIFFKTSSVVSSIKAYNDTEYSVSRHRMLSDFNSSIDSAEDFR